MLTPEVTFTLVHPNSECPKRQNDGDVGFDLYAPEAFTLAPRKREVIDSGVRVAVAPSAAMAAMGLDFHPHVKPRSSLAVYGFDVAGGVIDMGYRGTIGVILVNNTDEPLFIHVGQRLAQLVFDVVVIPKKPHVKDVRPPSDDAPEPDAGPAPKRVRGEAGFGSTGK